MGTTNNLLNAAYTAVSINEVGAKTSLADSVQPPATSTSGWTVGFNQEDFTAGTGEDQGAQAQATLVNALFASDQFSRDAAQDSAGHN
jgi:hypothetical protein